MNKIQKQLISINVCNENSLKLFHKGTRDNSDINVLKCYDSGILILDQIITNDNLYENNEHYDKINDNPQLLIDDKRRINQHKKLIKDKTILDFGCGQGDFLKLSLRYTKKSYGVEIHKKNRKELNELGITVHKTIDEFKSKKFDVIFLNHVFEHLTNPIKIINSIKKFLHKDSLIIIEVPHANDFLIKKMNNLDFKNFTFWSEHIILHTKKSMKTIFESCNYSSYKFGFFQRYPIANHIHWMNEGKPGGQNIYSFLNDPSLINTYDDFLIKNEWTDTLIGYFKLS